jgi:hypothetical protein
VQHGDADRVRSGQETAVTETEDRVVQAARRGYPSPVELEGIDGAVLYVNWAHITLAPGPRSVP